MLWPGHNFLGPGNDAFRPEPPVDSDDAIAQRHDIAYAHAKTREDIWRADREAFFEFTSDAIRNANWHSAVAGPILGGKYLLESALDTTLYPRNMPVGKREPPEHPSGGKRTKPTEDGGSATAAPLPDSSGGTQAGQDGANPQAGSSMPGGTGASVASTIIRNPSSGMHTIKFGKTFQLYTGGFQFKYVNDQTMTGMHARIGDIFTNGSKFMITPLAILNPDYKGLFMTQLEYLTLANVLAFASECKIRVKPLGYRLPFATNEAASGFANSQTLVQIAYAVGLNNQYNIVETGYGTSSTDLTEVTTLTDFNHYASLYGSNMTVGANVGTPRHWNNYTIVVVPTGDTQGGNSATSPNLINSIQIENVNDTKGLPIIEYTYNYKDGILNIPEQLYRQRDALGQNTPRNQNIIGEGWNTVAYAQFKHEHAEEVPSDNLVIESNMVNFNTRIELSHAFQRQIGQHLTPDRPPMIHFGCMPVQSNAALASTATFANAVVQWVVETELICHYQHDFVLPDTYRSYVQQAWDALCFPDSMRGGGPGVQQFTQYNPPTAYVSNRIVTSFPAPSSTGTRSNQIPAPPIKQPSPQSPSYQNYKALMEEEKRKALRNFPQPNIQM